MAAYKEIVEAVARAIGAGKKGFIYAGKTPQGAFHDLQKMNPSYTDPNAFISGHGVHSRFDKDGWSPERIGEAYRDILNSESTRGIPNFRGGERYGREALWLPDRPYSLFSPVAPGSGGRTNLLTVTEENTDRIARHLIDSGLARDPGIKSWLQSLGYKLPSAAPWLAGGAAGAGALFSPEEAAAWDKWIQPEQGLEQPWLDPASMLIAPVGAPGMAGKAAAALLDPFVSFGAETIMERLFPQPSRGGAQPAQ